MGLDDRGRSRESSGTVSAEAGEPDAGAETSSGRGSGRMTATSPRATRPTPITSAALGPVVTAPNSTTTTIIVTRPLARPHELVRCRSPVVSVYPSSGCHAVAYSTDSEISATTAIASAVWATVLSGAANRTKPARIQHSTANDRKKSWRLGTARPSAVRAARIWNGMEMVLSARPTPMAVGPRPRSSTARIWKIAPPSMPNDDPSVGTAMATTNRRRRRLTVSARRSSGGLSTPRPLPGSRTLRQPTLASRPNRAPVPPDLGSLPHISCR